MQMPLWVFSKNYWLCPKKLLLIYANKRMIHRAQHQEKSQNFKPMASILTWNKKEQYTVED